MTRRVALQKNALESKFGPLKLGTRSCGVRLLVVLFGEPDESPDAMRGTTSQRYRQCTRPPDGKAIKAGNKQ